MSTSEALIFTNGSSGVFAIERSGIKGQKISWDDVLHEGPVPNQNLESLTRVRAEFLSKNSELSAEEIHSALSERNKVLENREIDRPLILCFEHDLYDQLQLAQILYLAKEFGKEKNISLVQTDNYLSETVPDDLARSFREPLVIGGLELDCASRFWEAFTSKDPRTLGSLHPADLRGLPFLESARNRLRLLYPDSIDGLSLEERLILKIVKAEGQSSLASLFKDYQQREQAKFLGDVYFSLRIEWMLQESLLALSKSPDMFKDSASVTQSSKWNTPVQLTDLGRQLIEGEQSLLDLGIRARWIGGVSISDDSCWKWDNEASLFTR